MIFCISFFSYIDFLLLVPMLHCVEQPRKNLGHYQWNMAEDVSSFSPLTFSIQAAALSFLFWKQVLLILKAFSHSCVFLCLISINPAGTILSCHSVVCIYFVLGLVRHVSITPFLSCSFFVVSLLASLSLCFFFVPLRPKFSDILHKYTSYISTYVLSIWP